MRNDASLRDAKQLVAPLHDKRITRQLQQVFVSKHSPSI